jgi:N-carbamoylputrescine amidase
MQGKAKEISYMARVVKCGLIQAACTTRRANRWRQIRQEAIDKHLALIEEAARSGVQILCMQEIFTGPYFCAEQSTRWYGMSNAFLMDRLSN